MESSDLMPDRSPSDGQLDAWLRREAMLPPLPDGGFSARVIATLPPRRRQVAWRRTVLCAAGAGAGILLAFEQAGWPSSHVIDGFLAALLQTTASLFLAPNQGSLVAVALAAVIVTFIGVYWRDWAHRLQA